MHLFLYHTSGHIHTHCMIMGMAVCRKVCIFTISTRLSLCSFRPWLKKKLVLFDHCDMHVHLGAQWVNTFDHWLTHLGLTRFSGSTPGAIREIKGFVMHICATREMGAVFHDAYMRHQAKMSWIPSTTAGSVIKITNEILISTFIVYIQIHTILSINAEWHIHAPAKYSIIGSDSGLSPVRRQVII